MPRQPQWFQHVPAALEALRQLPAPVIDRAGLEKLLGVSRRDAIRLMHHFGGLQAGRTFLIGRQELAHALEAVAAGEAYEFEARRRTRVADAVSRAAEDAKSKAVTLEFQPRAAKGLPEAVLLRPGELRITYDTAEELLGLMYEVVQAAAQDFDGFKATVETERVSVKPA